MSEEKKDGGPAFPYKIESPIKGREGFECAVLTQNYHGLTKREWFAGMALQAQLSNGEFNTPTPERIAEWSFRYADAMLQQGEK